MKENKQYIIPVTVEIDDEVYSGNATLNMAKEPDVTNGAKILAYEVLKGKYGNAPYRKDNIYSAVMDYVNYLAKI